MSYNNDALIARLKLCIYFLQNLKSKTHKI